jgi:hypothetical protein
LGKLTTWRKFSDREAGKMVSLSVEEIIENLGRLWQLEFIG